MTLSAGIAEWRQDVASIDAMIALADNALYEAKRLGRNRVVVNAVKPVIGSQYTVD